MLCLRTTRTPEGAFATRLNGAYKQPPSYGYPYLTDAHDVIQDSSVPSCLSIIIPNNETAVSHLAYVLITAELNGKTLISDEAASRRTTAVTTSS